MLNRDFTNSTLNIIRATKPNIEAPIQPDWQGVMNQALKDYNEGAYTKQMIEEHPEDANKIRQMGGSAYADMLKADAERAEERQWALDDRQAQRDFQRDLLEAQFKNNMALEGIKNQNAKSLALFKAQNGIGTNGLVNINMSNPLDKKRVETIGKNMDTNIENSQKSLDTYNRMEQLLNSPNVQTGGVKGAALDALPDWMLNKETAELRAKIKETVPQMRPKGSGSTSDKDMKIFEQATVGLGKDKEANLNIVRGRKIVDENDIAKEELRYEWLTNGGNLADFDKQWRKYINENPIFANENGKLNTNRKNPYDWFYNPTPSLASFQTPQESIAEGTVIEDGNGNRMILRGGQWQQM